MFKYIKTFGLKIFIICSFSRSLRLLKINKNWIGKYVHWKNTKITEFLWQQFGDKIKYTSNKIASDDGFVFVFWWQGIENAPSVVKACIASIRQNRGGEN